MIAARGHSAAASASRPLGRAGGARAPFGMSAPFGPFGPFAQLGLLALLALGSVGCGDEAAPPAGEGDGEGTPVAATRSSPEAAPLAWRLAAGDASRSGSTPDPGPEDLPGILWSSPIARSAASEPVRAVTSAGRELVLLASATDAFAFDAETGREVWRHDMASSLVAAPLQVGGVVFVPSLDGYASLLSVDDGSLVKEIEWDFPIESAALPIEEAVAGRALLVFEETSHSAQDPRSMLHAVDARSGEEIWSHSYELGAGGLPAGDGERVFAAATDALIAVDAATGEPAWRHEYSPQQRVHGPLVADGLVLVTYGGRAQWTSEAIDAVSGRPVWSVKLGSRLSAPFARAGDEIVHPRTDGVLRRVAIADGALRGDVELPDFGSPDLRPAIAPRRVYLADGETILAIDRESWRPAWRLVMNDSVAGLTVAGDRLLVVTDDGFLHSLGTE